MQTALEVNRGSDAKIQLTWPDGADGAADLTNYDVEAYEAHPSLVAALTVAFISAAAGTISVLIRWNEDIPVDESASFRIRIVPKAGFTDLLKAATNKIVLRIV